MDIEFEATFPKINKNEVRRLLKKAGAKLQRKEFMQKRYVLHLPKSHERQGGWLRVRDEGDKVTMSLKEVTGDKIEDQREICVAIDEIEKGKEFLECVGCRTKAYQETKRELWTLGGVDITIDEWPFLEPFVELESDSEEKVRKAAGKIGFNYNKAIFCSVDTLYSKKYNFPNSRFNNETPLVKFDMKNPFI